MKDLIDIERQIDATLFVSYALRRYISTFFGHEDAKTLPEIVSLLENLAPMKTRLRQMRDSGLQKTNGQPQKSEETDQNATRPRK